MNNVLVTELGVAGRLDRKAPLTIYHGDALKLIRSLPDECVDLIVTSPPYCMGKDYENSKRVEEFEEAHRQMLPEIARVTKIGGSICWQVGYHVKDVEIVPLDFLVHSIMKDLGSLILRNRIIWTFGHGLHSNHRFSGRHEMVLWYTKGDKYVFDLDAVRVAQKYPGKRHYKGAKKGRLSGNPKGKNPSDVWDIPNVKAKHVEKTEHPCQFPVGLVDRLVRALTRKQALVCDPFMGSGSSGVAVVKNGRRFLGAEIDHRYVAIASRRCEQAMRGDVPFRSADTPVRLPNPTEKVSTWPTHFLKQQMRAAVSRGGPLIIGTSRDGDEKSKARGKAEAR